jgi:hypothetical protein
MQNALKSRRKEEKWKKTKRSVIGEVTLCKLRKNLPSSRGPHLFLPSRLWGEKHPCEEV